MKHILKPGLTLFAVAAVITALLALSHALTREPIENQVKRTLENTKRDIFTNAVRFEELADAETGDIVRAYECFDAGDASLGFILEMAPAGYGGAIQMMVGISSADGTVAGVRILKHSETPGLGALAARESFYRKFDGRDLAPLTVVKGFPGPGEIDAITGATITTRAVTDAVNEAMLWYAEVAK